MKEEADLTNDEYLQYCKMLMNNEMYAVMFIGMLKELRLEWLRLEYDSQFNV